MTELDSFTFVLLRRPAAAPLLSEPELDELQRQHLAHLDRLAEADELLGAGPLSDQPDDSLRGLCFFATTVEEARRLVAEDPAVRAGRLGAEVMTWSTPRGAITFHRAGRSSAG